MSVNNLDCRGLPCPQPVITVKKALETVTDGVITAIVDNAVAKENVAKFAMGNGCSISIEEQAGCFYIRITKGVPQITDSSVPSKTDDAVRPVFLFTKDTLGHGSDELGAVLVKSFMYTLVEKEPLPSVLLFMNAGVKLAVEGSPVLEHLKTLSEHGVEILSCGTCLDYFNLKNQLAVGTVTNMYTILDKITDAKKAITL